MIITGLLSVYVLTGAFLSVPMMLYVIMAAVNLVLVLRKKRDAAWGVAAACIIVLSELTFEAKAVVLAGRAFNSLIAILRFCILGAALAGMLAFAVIAVVLIVRENLIFGIIIAGVIAFCVYDSLASGYLNQLKDSINQVFFEGGPEALSGRSLLTVWAVIHALVSIYLGYKTGSAIEITLTIAAFNSLCLLIGNYLLKKHSVQAGAMVYTLGLAFFELGVPGEKKHEMGLSPLVMPFLLLIQIFLLLFNHWH